MSKDYFATDTEGWYVVPKSSAGKCTLAVWLYGDRLVRLARSGGRYCINLLRHSRVAEIEQELARKSSPSEPETLQGIFEAMRARLDDDNRRIDDQ